MKKIILILFILLFALEGFAAPKKRRIGESGDTLYVEQLKFNGIERRLFFDRLSNDNYIVGSGIKDTTFTVTNADPLNTDSTYFDLKDLAMTFTTPEIAAVVNKSGWPIYYVATRNDSLVFANAKAGSGTISSLVTIREK